VEIEPKSEKPQPIHKGSERVLFVDDEPVLAEIGKEALSALGYEVTVRTSSIEALDAFRAQPHKFDLVITDMTMPNMTGVQLADEILKVRPDIPIILCT
jgi:two-component system cell cycle sensor histidine kinase/response regulator CckA